MKPDQLLGSVETPPSLGEVAYGAIKKAIFADRLKPGIIYNEKTLAEDLGISKTPVHAALINLATEGVITILPRRGFQVVALTEKNVRDMYAFRKLLETAVIHAVAADLSPASIEKIDHILARFDTTADSNALGDTDRDLHSFLAALTRNQYVIESLNRVWDLSARVAVSVLNREKRFSQHMVREHLVIGKWLKKRNPEMAAKAMAEHLRKAEARCFKLFDAESRQHPQAR